VLTVSHYDLLILLAIVAALQVLSLIGVVYVLGLGKRTKSMVHALGWLTIRAWRDRAP
jgi:hypothetical protein